MLAVRIRPVTVCAAMLFVLLVALVTAVPARAATPSPTVLVERYYLDFLGRLALNDPDSRYWVARLGDGQDEAAQYAAVLDLRRTTEHADAQVGAKYRAVLGRDVDPGARYWSDQVRSGRMGVADVELALLRSSEEVARLHRAFVDVLGTQDDPAIFRLEREPTHPEQRYWTPIMLRSESDLYARLATTQEYCDRAVTGPRGSGS